MKKKLSIELKKTPDLALVSLEGVIKQAAEYATENPKESLRLCQKALQHGRNISANDRAALCFTQGNALLALGDYSRAIECLRDAERLFQTVGDAGSVAEAIRTMGMVHFRMTNYALAQNLFSDSIERYRRIADRAGELRVLNNLGAVAQRRAEYRSALELFAESERLAEKYNQPIAQATAILNSAVIYEALGDNDAALETTLRGLGIVEQLGDKQKQAAAYLTLSRLSMRRKEFQRAIEFAEKGLARFEDIAEMTGQAAAHSTLGEAYFFLKHIDKAFSHTMHSVELYRQLGDRWGEAVEQMLIGDLETEQQRFKSALALYKQCAAAFRDGGEKFREAEALYRMAKLETRRRKFDAAFLFLQEALSIANDLGAKDLLIEFLSLAVTLYRENADFENAFKAQTRIVELERLAADEQKMKYAETLRIRFDVAELQAERRRAEERATFLEQEMTRKQKNLLALATTLVQKNAFIAAIDDALRPLQTTTPQTAKKKLKGVLTMLRAEIGSGDNWKRFEREFAELHPNFLERLSARYPDLSPAEQKICVLLKLNLSTKDIAALLYASERTVENHRYRIRQKLGLESDANLSTFFATM